MEGNVLPSHADVAALDFTILDEPSGNKLCRINPQREIGGVSQKMLNQTLRRLERDGLVEPQGLPRRSPEGRIRPDTARQTAHRLASGGKWADQYLHKLEEARASDDNGRARQRLEVASGSGLQILTLVSNP